MADKPETKLQKKIQERVIQRGGYVAKIHGNIYSRGIPDLLVCYRSYFIGLEVKTPENKDGATKLQAANLRQVRRAGGLGFVVRSVGAVDRILDHVDASYGPQ